MANIKYIRFLGVIYLPSYIVRLVFHYIFRHIRPPYIVLVCNEDAWESRLYRGSYKGKEIVSRPLILIRIEFL